MLSAETETLIRLFMVEEGYEKRFNQLIKVASESKRKPDLQSCFDIRERLPKETMYREQILSGLDVIVEDLENAVQNKKKSFGDVITENAEKAWDNAGRLVANIKRSNKNDSLVLPQYYQKLKKKFPEGIGIPKDAVGYVMRTDAASCLLISYPVSEEISMPFDNPQWVIDEQHKAMGENEGLIEVENGTTASGKPFIYEVIKHRIATEDGIPHGVEYTLNINVRMDNSIQFINGSFAEEGTTGVRDNIVLAMYSNAKKTSMEDTMKAWFRDPYDSEFKRGFLMNKSEESVFDEQFPNHPLSVARALVKFIVENN